MTQAMAIWTTATTDCEKIFARFVAHWFKFFPTASSLFTAQPNRKDIHPLVSPLCIEFWYSRICSYIVESEQLDKIAIECDLTILCLTYLTFDCFRVDLG